MTGDLNICLPNQPGAACSGDIGKPDHKANQTTLLVSRPPVFIFLCGRAVIIHYSLFNIMAF